MKKTLAIIIAALGCATANAQEINAVVTRQGTTNKNCYQLSSLPSVVFGEGNTITVNEGETAKEQYTISGSNTLTVLFGSAINNEVNAESLEVAYPIYILDNGKLSVSGTMSNANANNLVIEDGGQLIHSSTGVMATFEKNVLTYSSTEATDGWNLIASPFNDNLSIADHTVLGENHDLYLYNEPTHYWYNSKATGEGSFNSLKNGKGYLYSQAGTDGNVIKMDGQLLPSTTDKSIELQYTPKLLDDVTPNTLKGFNLVGNPYACDAYLSLYVQSGDEEQAITQPTFLRLNQFGSEFLSTTGSYVTVKAGEGIFVSIPDGYESHVPEYDYFARFSKNQPQNAAPSQALDITVSEAERGANVINNAIVCFGEGFNTEKFMLNPENTKIFIPQNGKEYAAVSTSSTSGEIPVSFKAAKNGSYTITVNTENVEAEYMHLIDNLTGADVDLLAASASTGSASYSFEAKANDYASRFKLVFGVTGVDENASTSSANFAYISNGEIVISNEGRATLQVIDVMGRIISSEEINGECRISTNGMTAGVYVLNLNGMTQKIGVE